MVNSSEYHLMRSEIESVKNCIVTFTGFIIAGVGALVMAYVTIANTDRFGPALGLLSSSILITIVNLLLVYKFTSHNRMAAYCKAMSYEIFNKDNGHQDFYLWEACVHELRSSDFRKDYYSDDMGDEDLSYLANRYSPADQACDNNNKSKGTRILFKTMCGNLKSNSWAFPPYIFMINLLLSLGLFLFSIFTLCLISSNYLPEVEGVDNQFITFVLISIGVLFSIFLYLLSWASMIGKLHNLVHGSSTVNGYFFRFAYIRNKLLKQLGVDIGHPEGYFNQCRNRLKSKKVPT